MAGTLTFREAVSRVVNVFAEVMNAIAKKKETIAKSTKYAIELGGTLFKKKI